MKAFIEIKSAGVLDWHWAPDYENGSIAWADEKNGIAKMHGKVSNVTIFSMTDTGVEVFCLNPYDIKALYNKIVEIEAMKDEIFWD